MDIFFSVNNSWAEQLQTAMVSVLENNSWGSIHFHVLTVSLSPEARKGVERLINRYPNCDVDYPIIERSLLEKYHISMEDGFKEASFRYFIPLLYPQLKKALYLDVDLVCRKSLRTLWETDLSGFYCAGVRDLCIEKSHWKPTVGLQEADLYINSGVLLLNLEKIRQDEMPKKLAETDECLHGIAIYRDQDVINVAFRGKIKELDSIYNFCNDNMHDHKRKRGRAVLVHYNGPGKPWKWNCTHKLRRSWRKYAKLNQRIQEGKADYSWWQRIFHS